MSAVVTGNVSLEEGKAYVDYLGDYADLNYEFEKVPFERIRRITGYLVGTMDHWNDAKAAEEADRVKHDVSGGFERL